MDLQSSASLAVAESFIDEAQVLLTTNSSVDFIQSSQGVQGTSTENDVALFYDLLSWLGPDPEAGGKEYELIRRKLIAIFRTRAPAFAEDLADETIRRVASKLEQIRPCYSGDPSPYFYGVAKRIYLEHLRKMSFRRLPQMPTASNDREELLEHLEVALSKLSGADRELILSYYQYKGQTKIDHRRSLARAMGIPSNALRLRIHRIRNRLKGEILYLSNSEPLQKT